MEILEAIRHVVGPSSTKEPIPLHEPDFRGTSALAYVTDCLDTGWVSTAGQWVTCLSRAGFRYWRGLCGGSH